MKNIELTLIKDDSGITASNEHAGTVDFFDESEESRQEFIRFMLDEFINKEVDEGARYK